MIASKFRAGGARGFMISGVCATLGPATQLVAFPIYFKSLGAEMFGVWSLINIVISLTGNAGFGFSDAQVKFLAAGVANASHREQVDAIKIGSSWTLAIAVLVSIVIQLTVWLSPWIPDVYQKILSPLVFVVFSRFLYSTMESSLRGFGRNDIESFVGLLCSLGTTGISILAIKSGAGVPGMLWASGASFVVGSIALSFWVRMKLGTWAFTRLTLLADGGRAMFKYGVYTWAQGLNGVLLQQLDRIIISVFLGPAALGIYSVCAQVILSTHMVMYRALGVMFSRSVQAWAVGDTVSLWSLYKKTTFISSALAASYLGVVVFFSYDILNLWMGREFAEAAHCTFSILAIWGMFLASSIPQFYIMNATGLERLNALFGFMSSCIFICTALLAVAPFGLVAIALAKVASLSTGVVSRGIFMKRIFVGRRFWHGALSYIPFLCTPILFALLPFSDSTGRNYVFRFAFLIISILCSVGLAWRIYLGKGRMSLS